MPKVAALMSEIAAVNSHVEILNAHQPFDADFAEIFFESSSLDLQLETKAFDTLRAGVEDPEVRLVVLTGDAGHGKTHLCGLLVADLTGGSLKEASELLRGDDYGGSELARCPDGRSLRVIRDLSEKNPEAGGETLKNALEPGSTVTVVCGNDGQLRACANAAGLESVAILVNGSVTRGQMRSEDGFIALINLNHQSVVAPGDDQSILRQLLSSWVLDNDKWEECSGCARRSVCPIFHNRNQLAEHGQNGEGRIAAIETLLQVAEQTGNTITIRELLIYVAHLITGGLRCTDVEERVAERPDATDWQWGHLFHQVAFGQLLTAAQLRELDVFSGVRKLDPGRRAIRSIDDRLSDIDSSFGLFPPPYRASSGPTPTTTTAQKAEALEHKLRWRAARRWSFFEALTDSGDAGTVHPSRRVGLRHIADFTAVATDDLPERRKLEIRRSLVRGLEAIQGIHRSGQPGELYVANPAFLARNADTTVVGRKISLGKIRLMSVGAAWRHQSGTETTDVRNAIDWIDRFVVLSLDGDAAPPGRRLELMLHEFEFLLSAAKGLRSEQFFAAEIRRLFRQLINQGPSEEDPEQLIVFSGLSRHTFMVDGEMILRTDS